MSEKSEEFGGGAVQDEIFGGQGNEDGLAYGDIMQAFQSPPVPRKRKNNNRQARAKQQSQDFESQRNQAHAAARADQHQQEEAAATGLEQDRDRSNSSQRSGPFNLSLTAKKESLQKKIQLDKSVNLDEEGNQDDELNANSQFATQYEQAMLRVQKSREMQNVSNSLANTSQSVSQSQLPRSRGNKFVPSKQRGHSQMGSEQSRNGDIIQNMGSFRSRAQAHEEEIPIHRESIQSSRAANYPEHYELPVNQSEMPIDPNQISTQHLENVNQSLMHNHRRNTGARTVLQPSTPVAGSQSRKYFTQDRVNMSNLLRQANDDRVSISIKDQLQLQLQYAEAQEAEFRQQMREKRKRCMTINNPREQAEIALTKQEDDKVAGARKQTAPAAQLPQQSDSEGEFLQILRQQMVHLQERLKIEIRHKLTLMKHVSALQGELNGIKQREASARKQASKSQDHLEDAAPEGPTVEVKQATVATQTEPAIDIGKYERELTEASRAVRSGLSVLQENETKEGAPKDSTSQYPLSYQQQQMMDLADQTQDKQYPQNSLMFLEHQSSANQLPYHSIHNNGYDGGNNKNDVSEFKAAQNTYIVLPDSVLLQDVDGPPRGQDQSALQTRARPPSHSTFLTHMHDDEEGYVDVMPPGDSSGVASSIQRDDEVSKVLQPGDMNQTIRSSGAALKAKQNETMHDRSVPNANVALALESGSDVNRTDGDILFNQARKEALSFGARDGQNKESREEAPRPAASDAGKQKADVEQSSQVRPSAREKDMNVILESLNETQSQIDPRSPQVMNEQMRNQQDERMLDMQQLDHSDGQYMGGYQRPRHNSIAPPAFGASSRPPVVALDEEERRKIQMQWRSKMVKSHRKSNLDAQRKSEQHENEQKLQDMSINLAKSSTARDQKSQAEGSLLQDSHMRERTHSYKLIKYPYNQLTLSAHTLFDNPQQKKRTSIQMPDSDQSRLQVSRGPNGSEKADKDYKAMFQLLLEEKKRQVKNTKELIDKIHGLTDEIKVLKQKNKQLSTVINRFGNLDNHFEFPMQSAPQQSAQVNYQQSLTKFVQDQYDEVLQEQIYNQSVNFNLDQKHMQGLGNVQLHHDQTVVANKLHQDDRDILIQQMQRGRDSHNSQQEGRAKGLRMAAQFEREGRTSISPYKYKDPRLSADKSAIGPRNSNSRFNNNRFSANEHDLSQSNFANVTQHPGGVQESIPQTHNIEIRMRNRLRQNQNSHFNREFEKSPNSMHYMTQQQRQSIKEKIAEARGNQQRQIMRIQQLAGDNLSFNVDVEESNIMSAGMSSRHPHKKQHRSGAEVFDPQQMQHQNLLQFPMSHQAQTVDPAQGDFNSLTKQSVTKFNSQTRLESQLSARSAIYSKEYNGELAQSTSDLAVDQPMRLTKESAPQQAQVHFAEPQIHHAADDDQALPRYSQESATSNRYNHTMNRTSIDAERRSDPRQMMTKEQRRKLDSTSKGKKGKSGRDGGSSGGSGFMSILKKKLMRSGGKDDKFEKKDGKKRQSLGQRTEVEAIGGMGSIKGPSQRAGSRRTDSKEPSNRARSVGARDEEFEYVEDEGSDESQQQRLQQSEQIQRRDGKLDFMNLTNSNPGNGADVNQPVRETYNQRDTLDIEEKISSKQREKELRKKIKEDSKATRNQFKGQQGYRLSFNPGQYTQNQFMSGQTKTESEEQRSHFLDDHHSQFNQEEISLKKQMSANFGGSNRDPNDSLHKEEKQRQAEQMNLQFGQLASGNDMQNNQMGMFGQQQIGQSFNISAIPRDRDASQFFINQTHISIQNSTFNNASFMGPPGSHMQMAANFGGSAGSHLVGQSQLGHGSQVSGAFHGMTDAQNLPRYEYSDDVSMPAGVHNKDQIKEQFLRMSMKGKGTMGSQSSKGQPKQADPRAVNSSGMADPRSTSPIEAAMSMMSNTGGPASSRQDASAASSSLKLQNKQQRRKDQGKETKGLVFQNASMN